MRGGGHQIVGGPLVLHGATVLVCWWATVLLVQLCWCATVLVCWVCYCAVGAIVLLVLVCWA